MVNRRQRGVTLLELMVAVVILSAVVALAVPGMLRWSDAERVKAAARSVSDAFLLARSEAIRTGDNHLVVLAGALGAADPIAIVNDGPQASANCTIDAGEVVHRVDAQEGVSWGTSTGNANGAIAPDDEGGAAGNADVGWTFTDAGGVNPSSAVLFQSDGLPRLFTSGGGSCTAIGNGGEGGGGIYVTSGERDYAVVLRPLGTSRVHRWNPSTGAWSN